MHHCTDTTRSSLLEVTSPLWTKILSIDFVLATDIIYREKQKGVMTSKNNKSQFHYNKRTTLLQLEEQQSTFLIYFFECCQIVCLSTCQHTGILLVVNCTCSFVLYFYMQFICSVLCTWICIGKKKKKQKNSHKGVHAISSTVLLQFFLKILKLVAG